MKGRSKNGNHDGIYFENSKEGDNHMEKIESLYDKMFAEYPDVVGISDLMSMLSVGRHSAYELINSGQIQSFKIGRNIKIPKIKVIDFLINGNERRCCS
jgi:hypothetical protein